MLLYSPLALFLATFFKPLFKPFLEELLPDLLINPGLSKNILKHIEPLSEPLLFGFLLECQASYSNHLTKCSGFAPIIRLVILSHGPAIPNAPYPYSIDSVTYRKRPV